MGFLSKLFGKKEKELCPLCGGEMGFFSKTSIGDGAICDKCVARIDSTIDLGGAMLSSMKLDDLKALIEEDKKKTDAVIARFGGKYANIFKVDDVITISPSATEVGIARSKAMKNSVVAKGVVIAGGFESGDVCVSRGGAETPANLVEAVPYESGSDVGQVIAAHMYKGAVTAVKPAWMILASGADVGIGDFIVC